METLRHDRSRLDWEVSESQIQGGGEGSDGNVQGCAGGRGDSAPQS
jgi:hypothetical protein